MPEQASYCRILMFSDVLLTLKSQPLTYFHSWMNTVNFHILISISIQYCICRAAAIPRAKDGARFQMKLVHDQLTPLIMFLLQWIDSSCTCLLPRYLNLFHVVVYKVRMQHISLQEKFLFWEIKIWLSIYLSV